MSALKELDNFIDKHGSILKAESFIFDKKDIIIDYEDLKKLFEKYRYKIFNTKYKKSLPEKSEIHDKMAIKYDGISCLINLNEMRKDNIKYYFLNDIIDYLIMSFMKQDGYYYIKDGNIFLTDKGKEYIKED